MVTREGRFVGQEPYPEHPTGKALCVKGLAAAEIVYNKQRQLYPLKRTRSKGNKDPGWKRITWEEALDRTASELNWICSEFRARGSCLWSDNAERHADIG